MTFDLTHARHDPAHCMAPGLFQSLKRGDRKKLKLDITYNYGEQQLRFVGFEPLDAQDMRMLQGLIALSGPKGIILKDEPDTDEGRQLRMLLDPRLDAARADALVVKSKLNALMGEIGYATDGEQTRKDLKESLRRMANLTVFVSEGKREASFHLLSYIFDEGDGSLFVALNPRISETILGDGGFTRIEMSEVRALRTDPARLAHQRICAHISPNGEARLTLEKICEYIWNTECSPAAARQRKVTARKTVAELATLGGWTITEYAKDKYLIKRPDTRKRSLESGKLLRS